MRSPISSPQQQRRRRFTRVRQLTQFVFLTSGLAAALLINYFTDTAKAVSSASSTSVSTPPPASPGTRGVKVPATTMPNTVKNAEPVGGIAGAKAPTSSVPRPAAKKSAQSTAPSTGSQTTTPVATTPPVTAAPPTTVYTPPVTVTTVHVPVCTTTPSGTTTCV